jgi:hypothetical protein
MKEFRVFERFERLEIEWNMERISLKIDLLRK